MTVPACDRIEDVIQRPHATTLIDSRRGAPGRLFADALCSPWKRRCRPMYGYRFSLRQWLSVVGLSVVGSPVSSEVGGMGGCAARDLST